MKKQKPFIAFVLSLAMMMGLNTTAFAADTAAPIEDNTAYIAEASTVDIPENATRHELQLTLVPEWYEGTDADDGSASTYVWANPSMNLIDHHSANTASFYITDKYFAYEMEALPVDGTPTEQGYTIALRMLNAGTIASMGGHADGSNYKLDWITIDIDANYYFRVTNSTNFILSVDIVYYTWN